MPRIRDSNNRPILINWKEKLQVHIGKKVETFFPMCTWRFTVTLFVADRLGAPIILGCDLFDKQIEAIRPRKRVVENDDGTSVPIVRKITNDATKGGHPE